MSMTTKKALFFILLVSFLPLLASLSSPFLVHTHDGLVHLPRIGAFFKALLDGQFPVRWAGDLNHGYGMPLFIFIYHTPYLVASVFLLLGTGLVWAMKLSFLVSFLLSGVFMFLFADSFFKDKKKAILVTLLYQFAPFHLIDLTIRGSFGEVYTYAFLPLVLYAVTKFFQTKRVAFLMLSTIATALLVISHNSISLLFFGAICLFAFMFASRKKDVLLVVISLGVGLLLSGYYWIPALLEHKYTYGDLFMRELFKEHFPPLWKLFTPNLFDMKVLQFDNLSLQFGIFQTIAAILAVIYFFRKKIDKQGRRLFLYSFALIFFSLFFMSQLSFPLWENISFLRQFQFPWRFLSLIVFATALLGAYVLEYLKKFFWILAIIIIISSISYWFPKEGYDKIDEQYYWNFPLNTTYYGETDVIWSAGPAKSYPKNRVAIIEGEGEIQNLSKKSNRQIFSLRGNTDVSVVSNTQYFPGWRVYVDNASIPIEFQNQNYRGLITFTAPKGNHAVRIQFEESKIRLAADLISIVAAIVVAATLFFFRKKTV